MSAMMRMREGACCGDADKYAASRVPPAEALSSEEPPAQLLVRGGFEEAGPAALDMLREHGGAIWDGLVPESALAEARKGLEDVMAACRANFDAETDKINIRHRDFGIVRLPMVGAGKKNIHFDPHGSACYDAMDALAKAGRFQEVLERYWGRPCSLSESGLSVTRPMGEGMEWHADGTAGEATVLVTLEDVHPSLGCLGVIPGSHKEYSTDKARGGGLLVCCREDGKEVTDDARGAAAASRALWYPYRAGVPCIFDARTLHCAANNTNDDSAAGFRFVLWYIYNEVEGPEGDEEDGGGVEEEE